jgi:hypothetical protein
MRQQRKHLMKTSAERNSEQPTGKKKRKRAGKISKLKSEQNKPGYHGK